MSEDSIKPKDLNEISTRLSELNVMRISLVDEPAVPDAEFKIIKHIVDMEDNSLDNEQLVKSLDTVSTQLQEIISQRDEDTKLIKSVITDTQKSSELSATNAIAIEDLASQIAGIMSVIETKDESTNENPDEETILEPNDVITDVVQDSEQGLNDEEIEKFSVSYLEHYESGRLDMDTYKANLEQLIS